MERNFIRRKSYEKYPFGGAVAYLDAFVGTTEPAVLVDSRERVQQRHVRATGTFVREPPRILPFTTAKQPPFSPGFIFSFILHCFIC